LSSLLRVLVCFLVCFVFFFFFSSRRRHTRCYRDWSSDVCSSDLWAPSPAAGPATAATRLAMVPIPKPITLVSPPITMTRSGGTRSEERRVGKESRDRAAGEE